MADAAKRKATYADLEAVPPHLVAEIIFGALVTHPRPIPKHRRAQHEISLEVGNPYGRGKGGPGGWVFEPEPELHLGEHVVIPDLAGWKRERYRVNPNKVGITIPPDWICEILSPSTELYDKGEKRAIYARAGIAYYWILDPRIIQLECYQLVASNWLLTNVFEGGQAVSAPPFEAATFPLNTLFPDEEKSLE